MAEVESNQLASEVNI